MTIHRSFFAATLTAVTLICAAAGTAMAKPKVAVMELSDQTRSVNAGLRESLTDALRSNLAQSGRFVVIDKGRQAAALKRLVAEQKKESYKACYASSCQIPLGQALAADTVLRTKLTRVGSSYLLIGELVDLAKEAVTHAAQVRIRAQPKAGRDDRLLDGLTRLGAQLTGSSARITPRPTRRPTYRRPAPTPEQLEARRQRQEAYQRNREERRRRSAEARQQRQIEHEQRKVRRSRSTRMIYGWMFIGSAAALGGLGAYYATAKASDAADLADTATSPSALKTAADDVRASQTAGFVMLGLAAASAAIGAYLLLTIPSLEQQPMKVGDVELDRLPSGGPTADGAALSWGGRF
jgi:Peptidoglycan-synthase activator LpoB